MAIIIKNTITTSIFLFVLSLILIITGAILTITILFAYFGIPILIIGILLLIFSIIFFTFSVLGGISSIFKPRRKDKTTKITSKLKEKKETKKKIIDVKEKEGIWEK